MKLTKNIYSFVVLSLLSFQITSISFACDVIIPGEDDIIAKTVFSKKEMESMLRTAKEIETSETKIKGRLGELAALHYFNTHEVFDQTYVNLRDVFGDMGCEVVSNYLKDEKDAGIDDIFVIQTGENSGLKPDFRTNPIFHESKFSSSCELRLPDTKTMCQQMSPEWLTKNLKLASNRSRPTGQAKICMGNHIIEVESCEECRENFDETIKWLLSKLRKRQIVRTASVLCPNGEFTLYRITEE